MRSEAFLVAAVVLFGPDCPLMSGDTKSMRVEIDESGLKYRACLHGSVDGFEFKPIVLEPEIEGWVPRAFSICVEDENKKIVGGECYWPYYTFLSRRPLLGDYRRLSPNEEYCSQWHEIATLLLGLHVLTDSSAETWMRLKIEATVGIVPGEYLEAESAWFPISKAVRDILLKREREPEAFSRGPTDQDYTNGGPPEGDD